MLRAIFIFLFLALLQPAAAQPRAAEGAPSRRQHTNTHLPVRAFTADDGLGGATITSLLKDKRGFLWIGTPDELLIYDGIRFQPFRYTDSAGASQAFRRAFLFSLDEDGVLIVHEEGSHQYRLPAGRLRALRGPIRAASVSTDASVHGDPTSPGMFMLDAPSIRARLDARRGQWIAVLNLPPAQLPAMGAGKNGGVILDCDTGATAREFSIRSRDAAHNFREDHRLPFRGAAALVLAGEGTLFLDAADAKTLWWKGRGQDAHTLLTLPAAARAMWAVAVGEAFYIAAGQSLLCFKPRTAAVEVLAAPGADRLIRTGVLTRILPDGRTLWLGTNTNGLVRVSLEGPRLRHLKADSAVLNWSHAIGADAARGRIYVGGYSGTVAVFDTAGRFLKDLTPTLRHAAPTPSAYINAIEPLPGGQLLIFSGLNPSILDPATGAVQTLAANMQASKKAHGIPLTPYMGRYGVLRCGPLEWWTSDPIGAVRWRLTPATHPGKARLDVAQVVPISKPAPEAFCAYNGALWCASAGRLFRFDRRGLTDSFRYPIAAFATCIAPDAQGRLWIGTESGIAVWKEGRVERMLTTESGLPNNHVYALLADGAGRMWGSTNGGLFAIATGDFSVRAFTGGEGLQGAEFNLGAAAKDARGRLYFGGMNGVNIVEPAVALRHDAVSPVTITRVAGADTIYHTYPGPASPSALRLPHDRASLTISFTSPQLEAAGPLRFEYRLRDEDSVWTDNGTRRELQLFLAPGSYRVEVRVRGNPATVAGFSVEVAPPFYRTWWFISLLIVGGSAVVITAILRAARRRYEGRLQAFETARRIQWEKERISRELHDELGARAALLAHNVSMLKRTEGTESIIPLADRVQEATSDMLTALRETVWTLKQESVTLESLWLRYKNFIAKLDATYAEIHFSVEEEPLPDQPLDYGRALNLLRILQEAVMNAVKHSGGTRIAVGARLSASHAFFSVRDNGRGFNAESAKEKGEGNGLHNMAYRAAEAGLVLSIRPDESGGSVVEIALPLA